MSKVLLIWKAGQKTDAEPVMGDQFVAMGDGVLTLRHPWTIVSALMGKLEATSIIASVFYFSHLFAGVESWNESTTFILVICILILAFISLILWQNISHLRKRSHYHFNRGNQRVYFNDGKYLWIGDWRGVQAGAASATDVTTKGAVIRYYLELQLPNLGAKLPPDRYDETHAPRPAPATLTLRISSNDETLGLIEYVSQVWEYIRIFMEQGPDTLVIPTTINWWLIPEYKTYLTPREALRRYVPWRTGEVGEEQGKAWWALPFWAVMFPYNMFLALCWWATCVVFKVRPAAPPEEAMQGRTGPMVTIEMAAERAARERSV